MSKQWYTAEEIFNFCDGVFCDGCTKQGSTGDEWVKNCEECKLVQIGGEFTMSNYKEEE